MVLRANAIPATSGRLFGNEHLPIDSLPKQDAWGNTGELSPALVWYYTPATKAGRFVVGEDVYGKLDFHTLLSAGEASKALRLICRYIRVQRREHHRSQHLVSMHRIRDNQHRQLPHICVTTLTRSGGAGLSRITGMGFRLPTNSATCTARFECVGRWLSIIVEQLGPYYDWVDAHPTSQASMTVQPAPFDLVWRCGQHIISPSRFSMLAVGGDSAIRLSLNQARFIALLLGARDRNGLPSYVERSITRREVFNLGRECTICDNDIDKLVMFFRQHFGRSAIVTLRGYGHVLTMRRRICNEQEVTRVLGRLWC